jgi:Ca2+-transporting ATPase
LTGNHWWAIGGWGVTIAICVLAALSIGILWRHMQPAQAVTVSFLTLGFAKLWFVFNLRDRGSSLLRNDIVRNPWVWLAIALCTGLLLAAAYAPGLSEILETRPPGGAGWGLIILLGALPFVVGQILRARQTGRHRIERCESTEGACV